MAVANPTTVRTQILTGVYPANTINSDGSNIFAKEQYVRRRKYPSCEVIAVQPESSEENKRQTVYSSTLEVRYYIRNIGDAVDEVTTQKSVEDEIIRVIELMTLDDHKVVLESKQWNRRQVQQDRDHPAYQVSVLRIQIRQITPTTATSDAVMIFDITTSSVDNEPVSNYQYTNVFDVDIDSGYRDITEPVTDGPNGLNIPMRFAGAFSGRVIFNVPVKNADLGTTGDKLNKLEVLNSFGEKGTVGLIFREKTMDGTPLTIQEAILCRVESVQRLYRYNDQTVFRVIGNLIKPTTVTTF